LTTGALPQPALNFSATTKILGAGREYKESFSGQPMDIGFRWQSIHMGMIDLGSRIPGDSKIHWLGLARTCLVYGVGILLSGLIVLKIAPYIPIFSTWPYYTLITGYVGKALLLLSPLLVLTEILVTRHPFYEIWLLAALGGIMGVLAC
jgi:hypothetical protein